MQYRVVFRCCSTLLSTADIKCGANSQLFLRRTKLFSLYIREVNYYTPRESNKTAKNQLVYVLEKYKTNLHEHRAYRYLTVY